MAGMTSLRPEVGVTGVISTAWTFSLEDNMTSSANDTTSNGTTTPPSTVHDLAYDFTIRISILYVEIILGFLGAMLLFLCMVNVNKRRLSRVNVLILNLCVADLLVTCFSSVTQLVWEYLDRRWLAGDALCRIIKLLQIFALCASTNMLVVIAVDRHQAITAPLRKPFSVWGMVSVGWGLAFVCSIPMLFVFHVRYDAIKEMDLCENTFRGKPRAHRQAFLTYAALVNFLIPLVILCVCYIRIFTKIARKAKDSQVSKRQSFKPGKIQLTSNTTSATLNNAKLKTLKMTVVIVVSFIVCGLPYFVAEMIMSYGDHTYLSPTVYGLLGGIAVANSATNPYIVLLFSVNNQCLHNFNLCPARTVPNSRQLMYTGSVRSHDYSTALYSRAPPCTDTSEMTTSISNHHAKSGFAVNSRPGNSRWVKDTTH